MKTTILVLTFVCMIATACAFVNNVGSIVGKLMEGMWYTQTFRLVLSSGPFVCSERWISSKFSLGVVLLQSIADVSRAYPSRQTCDKTFSSSALNMALEGQSPQVRKNVMAAAVSAAAMPALASTLTALSATAIPAAVATQFAQAVWLPSAANDWRVLTAVFLAHWFVTNQILQQFPDESEIAAFKKAETKKRM